MRWLSIAAFLALATALEAAPSSSHAARVDLASRPALSELRFLRSHDPDAPDSEAEAEASSSSSSSLQDREDSSRDAESVRSLRFAKRLQKDSDKFVAKLEKYTQSVVGNVSDVEPLLDTKFTLTTSGAVDLKRPCGALVGKKVFRIVRDFIEHPDTAQLEHGDELLWRPSRECLYGHNSIEIDGGTHITFEMRCEDAVLLNATVASGGITRKVFWHNVEASGSFVAVDFLDGQVKTIGTEGSLDALDKYRKIPANLDQVLEAWKNAVHECAVKSKLLVHGVVGGGWRQKFAEWGSLGDSSQVSVVGYAEAFEIAYHPKTAAPTLAPPTTAAPDVPATSVVLPPPAPAPATTETTPAPVASTPAPSVPETPAPPATPVQEPEPTTSAAPATTPTTPAPVPETAPVPPPEVTPVHEPEPATPAVPAPVEPAVPEATPAPPPTEPAVPETTHVVPTPATTAAPPPPATTPASPVPATTPAPPPTEATPAPPPAEATPAPPAEATPAPPAETTPAPPPPATTPAPPPSAVQAVLPAPAIPTHPPEVFIETISAQDALQLPPLFTSFDASDLKTKSQTASGIYVQSGLECAKDRNTTDPCFITHALPKLTVHDHNALDVPMDMTYSQSEDFSARSLLSMWPLLLLIAVSVSAAIVAVFITYIRRRGYDRIPTVTPP